MKVKPIKNFEKIEEMKRELEKCDTKTGERVKAEKKRNRAMFCFGINSALRISDICSLDLNDIFNEDLTFKEFIGATEQKTKKYKEFPLTSTVKEELSNYICWYLGIWYEIPIYEIAKNYCNLSAEYKEQIREIVKTKPLFPSERDLQSCISRVQAYRIIKEAGEKIGLQNVGTHTMRKTFGYWFFQKTKDLPLLQKIYNHSSIAVTAEYLDLGQEEINRAYYSFGL